MANYAKNIPRDAGGQPMQSFPPNVVHVQTNMTTNQVASSMLNIHSDASMIEVAAFGGQGAVIRWIPASETAAVAPYGSVVASGAAANFDHHVPTGWYRQFVLPKDTQGAYAGGIGSVNGLYQRVAISNAGTTATSILVTQF